ncbi:DUF3667 domain-containing protein [Pseudochryseolinea flava]|nr:DUF3667 domain-containing protein [Pseudochryseolinea flava]
MINTCKNCSNEFSGKYCNECGEKVYSHDRSFKHLFEEVFHFFTHFEGTLFNTLRVLPFRPGQLSLDFINGIRRRYFKPIPFFLMAVILYLMFPLFGGLNMKLSFHLASPLYGEYATSLSEKVQEQKDLSPKELEEAFHYKGEKTSKFLLIIIIPFTALVSYAMAFRKRKYYYDHFIFATEIASVFILWGFLLLPLIKMLFASMGMALFEREGFVVIIMGLGLGLYVNFAAKRFFEWNFWIRTIYTIVLLTFLFAFVQTVYKFILFVIAIHLV